MKINTLVKKFIIWIKSNIYNYKLKNIRNECVIFGSGPSINKLNIDSQFLKNKDLIACNFIHKNNKFKSKEFRFYSLIDIDYSKSIDKNYFKGLNCKNILITTKNAYSFNIQTLLKRDIKVVKTKVFNLQENYKYNDISSNNFFLTGNSVPFLIQIAALLGKYKTIYLFGVDHFDATDLQNLEDMNFRGYKGRNVKKLRITKEKLSYINNLYKLMKKLLSNKGIKIINLTPNSKLKYFKSIVIDDFIIENI